jgi:DNA-binding beta-propeller fold protein YncE
VAIALGGKHACVTGSAVSVIDTKKGVVTETVHVAGLPYLLAVTPDSKHVYVRTHPGAG